MGTLRITIKGIDSEEETIPQAIRMLKKYNDYSEDFTGRIMVFYDISKGERSRAKLSAKYSKTVPGIQRSARPGG